MVSLSRKDQRFFSIDFGFYPVVNYGYIKNAINN
jgi:hypothetical protein